MELYSPWSGNPSDERISSFRRLRPGVSTTWQGFSSTGFGSATASIPQSKTKPFTRRQPGRLSKSCPIRVVGNRDPLRLGHASSFCITRSCVLLTACSPRPAASRGARASENPFSIASLIVERKSDPLPLNALRKDVAKSTMRCDVFSELQ